MTFAESNLSIANFTLLAGYCQGSDDSNCTLPMSQLWATTSTTAVNLQPGEPIRVKVKARNAAGWSVDSDIAQGSTVVMAVPANVSSPLTNNAALTSTSQIVVNMDEIATQTPASGYATITSYNLQWNGGSGTSFTSLVGEASDSTDREITVTTGISAGQAYTFRYRVKNIFGWSGNFSQDAIFYAASRPS